LDTQRVWKQDIYVRTYETDFENRWKPAGFFNAIQEVATNHATHLGFAYQDMLAQNRIWILSRVKIKFVTFPTMQDTVTVKSWPRGIDKKVFFMRDFSFTAQDGSPYAVATSAWVLIDPTARRLLQANALQGQLPLHDECILDEQLDKILPKDGLPERVRRSAGYSAIDMMGHVNNARYIEWICDCFTIEHYARYQLDWLQINYLNEVKPGDLVALSGGERDEDGLEWVFKAANQTASNWAFEAALHWMPR
jgi:acyl-ACP thioesterase